MLREVLANIEKRHRFVLTSHARPDGDAIGSALACGQILRAMGKEAEVVMHDPVPRIYQPLPFADKVKQAERVNGNYGDSAGVRQHPAHAPAGPRKSISHQH